VTDSAKPAEVVGRVALAPREVERAAARNRRAGERAKAREPFNVIRGLSTVRVAKTPKKRGAK
jgi:hypothetical protein